MLKHQEFLQYAEQCTELAETVECSRHREALKSMARVWRELAAEEERIVDLVRAVDQLFPSPFTATTSDVPGEPRRGLIPRLTDSLLYKQFRSKTGAHPARTAPSPASMAK